MPTRRTYGDTSPDLEDSTIPLLRDSTSLDYQNRRAVAGEDSDHGLNQQSRQHNATWRAVDSDTVAPGSIPEAYLPWWSRETFTGAMLFNTLTFLLPAIHMTTAKLWVSQIDSSLVVATDIYANTHTIVEILNEGLPKVAFLVIADKSSQTVRSRIQLSNTLLLFQTTCGLLLTSLFFFHARTLAELFLPEAVREASLSYIRVASVSSTTYAVEIALASATRCLDKPDIPLMIMMARIMSTFLLDILILSKWRIGADWFTPTIVTQASIRCFCELSATICGLAVYITRSRRMLAAERAQQALTTVERHEDYSKSTTTPSWDALLKLARPGVFTMLESAFRNVVYLWIVSEVVKTGLTYATAFGVFTTIRWGMVMVPVYAFEASSATFVGHRWGVWRNRVKSGTVEGEEGEKVRATVKDLKYITRPAFVASIIVLCVQIFLGSLLSFYLIRPFAYFISGSDAVSELVAHFWRTVDWCYTIFAVGTQASTILLATQPKMYSYKSILSVGLWDLPWAFAVTKVVLNESNGWAWHGWIFGGGCVWGGFLTMLCVAYWWWALSRGKLRL